MELVSLIRPLDVLAVEGVAKLKGVVLPLGATETSFGTLRSGRSRKVLAKIIIGGIEDETATTLPKYSRSGIYDLPRLASLRCCCQ
jgi:hypothetical protein